MPPVQTDVNIGMVSTGETETPTYQLAAEEVLPLTVNFSVSDQVTEVRAFVLRPFLFAPMTDVWNFNLQ